MAQLPPNIGQQLREAIVSDGRPLTALGVLSGVDKGRLSRFVRGERDLSLEGAAAVCQVLGLHLAELKPPRRRKGG